MRRPFLFGAAFASFFFGALHAEAQYAPAEDPVTQASWQRLGEDEKAIVDLMAADFFETALQPSQSRRIEAATAEAYLMLSPSEQLVFRENRLRIWREMKAEQKHALRGSKQPNFMNLTEAQKLPFRRHALDFLGGERAAVRNYGAQPHEI